MGDLTTWGEDLIMVDMVDLIVVDMEDQIVAIMVDRIEATMADLIAEMVVLKEIADLIEMDAQIVTVGLIVGIGLTVGIDQTEVIDLTEAIGWIVAVTVQKEKADQIVTVADLSVVALIGLKETAVVQIVVVSGQIVTATGLIVVETALIVVVAVVAAMTNRIGAMTKLIVVVVVVEVVAVQRKLTAVAQARSLNVGVVERNQRKVETKQIVVVERKMRGVQQMRKQIGLELQLRNQNVVMCLTRVREMRKLIVLVRMKTRIVGINLKETLVVQTVGAPTGM